MQIIDAHHHLWDLSTCAYPWLQSASPDVGFLGDISAIRKSYTSADYRSDIGSLPVKGSVHVQAEHDPADPVAETRWLQAQADRPDAGGFPQAIVAFADFSKGNVEDILARHAEFRNVRGIRQILSHHPDPTFSHAGREFLKDPLWCARLSALRTHNFSFDLQIYPHQVKDALSLIDSNPSILFVINHALEPWSQSDSTLACWSDGIKKLARRENTVVKISGLGMFIRPFSEDAIRFYVLALIDVFGVNRCMVGSNFPVDKLFCSYGEIFSAFDRVTQSLSTTEREALFSRTAERTYRL